jgi:hypothetical protein
MNMHTRERNRFTPTRFVRAVTGAAMVCAALAAAPSLDAAEDTIQQNTRGGIVTADRPPSTTTVGKKRTAEYYDGKTAKETVVEKPEGLRIHGLINLNFSDHYLTPRGLNVENEGLIFQPLVLLFWGLYHDDSKFLNDVTLTTGVWNSFHSRESGPDPDNWNEIDPIFGISFGFAKDFRFDATYTIFRSQNGSFETSQNLELKISFDDSKLLGPFALHPWAGIWIELDNKATFATSSESFYGEIGIDPSYSFTEFPCASYPLKVEFPTYITLPADNFYGAHSIIGVASTGVKLSMPLSFIPTSCGKWSVYSAYNYSYFDNPALVKFGSFATGDKDHHEGVVSGGLTCVF